MRYLILLALLTGCEFSLKKADDSMASECYIDGIKIVTVDKGEISCQNMSINVAHARDLMISHRFLEDEADFNRWYHNVEVEVMTDERCLEGPHIGLISLPGCVWGQYWTEGEMLDPVQAALATPSTNRLYDTMHFRIQINHDGKPLAHEFLHHWDTTHGRADLTSNHTGWRDLGYYQLSDDFEKEALPVALFDPSEL